MNATIRLVISASSLPPTSGKPPCSPEPPALTFCLWMLGPVECSLVLRMLDLRARRLGSRGWPARQECDRVDEQFNLQRRFSGVLCQLEAECVCPGGEQTPDPVIAKFAYS